LVHNARRAPVVTGQLGAEDLSLFRDNHFWRGGLVAAPASGTHPAYSPLPRPPERAARGPPEPQQRGHTRAI